MNKPKVYVGKFFVYLGICFGIVFSALLGQVCFRF